MIAARIRQMAGPHWLALFALILAAWCALYVMALPADLRAAGRLYGAEFWTSLCAVSPDGAGFARVAVMWLLMSLAMMAPTALPAFATYDELPLTEGKRFGLLVAGYFTVWAGFSLLAAAAQMGLYAAGLVSVFGDSLSTLFSAALLALAGLYQFSEVKQSCLSKCRAPLTFFFQYIDEGPWRNGLRLGLVCLGCCWALMLLAFVGGVMNIAFMGLATLIMVIEKLPDLGKYVTRKLGWLLLAGAAAMAVATLF